MEVTNYIDERILVFKEKLDMIAKRRVQEISKPYGKRNYQALFILHKDEILFKFCLSELELIKQKMQ